MCGICGELNFVSSPRAERVGAMTEALAHRGPDDSGTYSDAWCHLGHRRLSIIDLDHGQQPLTNENQELWLIGNGEIYNYRELRSDLVARGHRFRSESDIEVILHLYEELGRRCVTRLRGMFAFAIWDKARKRLTLARDRFGQKPMFYLHQGNTFLFASEIKGLLAGLDSTPPPDDSAIHDYLSLRFIPHPRTMFAGVSTLPPAHTLVWDGQTIDVERYWSLAWEPKTNLGALGQREELKTALEEAVQSHLVSDVPVGAYLSGGIDSSLVTAIAARALGRPLPTFAIGSEWSDFNELPYAKRVAEQYGTEHHELVIGPDMVERLPRIVWQLDQPGDPITACVQCAAELAGQHVKVVLGGDGADELFGKQPAPIAKRPIP